MRTCDVCGDKHWALGYCRKHYRQHRRGWTEAEILLGRRKNKKQKHCSVCNEPFYAKGYCHKHYQQRYRFGWTEKEVLKGTKNEVPRCRVPNCTYPRYKDGVLSAHGNSKLKELCEMHYALGKLRVLIDKADKAIAACK